MQAHVKSVEHKDQQVDIVADGYLYVDGLRVYLAKDLRLSIVESIPLKNR